MSLDRIDPHFVKDLADSFDTAGQVSAWLARSGYPVTMRPMRVRPDASKRKEFSDDGDLEVGVRVEVKKRNVSFASFLYDTLIVDVKHSWDNASPKPFAYVMLDRDGVAAVVLGALSPLWVESQRHDKGRMRQYYECPVNLVQFYQPGEPLRLW